METWCLVGVVIPIGAVQKGCREDEQRVVVLLANTLQKCYGHPSPEQVNLMKWRHSRGSTLPSRVRAEDGTGRTQCYGRCGSFLSRDLWLTGETGFYAFGRERERERERETS
jgi:hypothetical protein